MKRCNKCEIQKDVVGFYKRKGSLDGLHNSCKECMKQSIKVYREENPETTKINRQRYFKQNREEINARNKLWREKNPDYFSEWHKKKRVKDELSHSTQRGADQ